ncbi:MAG: hypothetical protein WEB03_13680 [Nitriliruptor sp.]|uniref:hypothetical protein n=1 Tax=Nitriliruptor sp. TaxID=2448056 RepID=UPI0034A03C63
MTMLRRLTLLPLTLLLLLVGAAPALADPAGPTNYRSTIESVEPNPADVDVEVLGGDAFLVLSAGTGTTVTVEGYDDEPYLRFLPDGTVERNAASPARWLNDARYGAQDTTVPPGASAEAPPRWEQVATDGTYAWHDHRIHWMSPALPRQIDPAASTPQEVTDWSFQIEVDDEPVTVSGRLEWLPSSIPLLPALVFLAVAALGIALVWRRTGATAVIAAVGAVAAAVVGVASSVGLPSGVQVDPATVFLPGVALAIAASAHLIRRRPGLAPRLIGGSAGVPLIVWVALRFDALTAPILPTSLPAHLARSLIAAAFGAGLAALFGTGRLLLTGPGPRGTSETPDRDARPGSDRTTSGRASRHASASVLAIAAVQPLMLAHAGEGATWQALLVVSSLGMVIVFGLVLIGRVQMSQPDDLVLPLAGVAIVSSLAPLGGELLSDWVGWAFPIGVVALVALILAALTPLRLAFTEPATYGAVASAAIGAIALQGPITVAWHPPTSYRSPTTSRSRSSRRSTETRSPTA